jgi:hypothetical protein
MRKYILIRPFQSNCFMSRSLEQAITRAFNKIVSTQNINEILFTIKNVDNGKEHTLYGIYSKPKPEFIHIKPDLDITSNVNISDHDIPKQSGFDMLLDHISSPKESVIDNVIVDSHQDIHQESHQKQHQELINKNDELNVATNNYTRYIDNNTSDDVINVLNKYPELINSTVTKNPTRKFFDITDNQRSMIRTPLDKYMGVNHVIKHDTRYDMMNKLNKLI